MWGRGPALYKHNYYYNVFFFGAHSVEMTRNFVFLPIRTFLAWWEEGFVSVLLRILMFIPLSRIRIFPSRIQGQKASIPDPDPH
jgi:hypothetical protein